MALEGDLRDFSLPDLINLVLLSKKRGALVFSPKPGDEWIVYFDEKGVVHAEHGENEGEKVLERLLTFKSGPFAFNPNKTTSKRTITKSHEELSMYLSMLGEVWNEIEGSLPPLDTDLAVESDYSEIVLNNLELKMLLLVATRVKMKAILDEESKVGIRELESLSNLIKAGLIKPTVSPVVTKTHTPTTEVSETISKPVFETTPVVAPGPVSRAVSGIKLSVVKSYSIDKDVVQIDKAMVNNWVLNNLFFGRVIIKDNIFVAELKTGLGKALIIADKTARSLGLKDGEEIEVKPYLE